MTVLYIGSAVDPIDHMHGLPASLVERDAGSSLDGKPLDLGRELEVGRELEGALLGTEGTSLATGVLQLAVGAISQKLGAGLLEGGGAGAGPAAKAALADPVQVEAAV